MEREGGREGGRGRGRERQGGREGGREGEKGLGSQQVRLLTYLSAGTGEIS